MDKTFLKLDDLLMNKLGKKAEGFERQTLIVLPRPVREKARAHPLLRALYPTDAGYYPEAAGHQKIREKGSPTAILILCLAGVGWVRIGEGGTVHVPPGTAVLIAPRQAHAYGADELEPWTILWTHFSGEELSHWWSWLGLAPEGGCMSLPAGVPDHLELARVQEQLRAGYDETRLLAAAAALRWALSNLRHQGPVMGSGKSGRDNLQSVAAWMEDHLDRHPGLEDMARQAGLSPSHFSLLFKKRFGYAPGDYFIRLKIRRACGLFHTTTRTIAEIAREVGYEDPFYFSRHFRRVMGQSPRDYRRETIG